MPDAEQHQPSDPAADAETVADLVAPASDQPDDEAIRQMAADKLVQAELDGPDTRDMVPPPERPETAEDEDEEQKEQDDDAERTEDVEAKDGDEDESPSETEDKEPRNFRMRQARKYKRQADEAYAEAKSILSQVEQAKAHLDRTAAELAPYQALTKKVRDGDIDGAIDELARRAGMSSHDVLERYVRRKAGEPDYQRGPLPEVNELREELRAMREERRQEREQWQREQQQAQLKSRVSDAIDECMTVQSDERLGRLWPHAAALPAKYLREQLRAMVPNAIGSGSRSALDDMMAAIDEQAKVLQNHYQQVHGSTGIVKTNAKTGPGRGSPATEKADNPAPQLSNESAAATVSGRRAKTADEIAAEVDAIAAQAAEDYLQGNVL